MGEVLDAQFLMEEVLAHKAEHLSMHNGINPAMDLFQYEESPALRPEHFLMHDGINPGMDLFDMEVLGRLDGRNNALPGMHAQHRNQQSILNFNKKLSSRLKTLREQYGAIKSNARMSDWL